MNTHKNKSMLLVGGGFADIPLIKAAQSLGFRVVSTGNNAKDAGHRISDHYHPADFSKPDEMLEVARSEGVEAICANCNDFSAISSAYVAERLGLPGHDSFQTALLIHHKDRFRKYANEQGLPCPAAKSFEDPVSATEFALDLAKPAIVKPVDLTGGKGISRFTTEQEAEQAIQAAFSISRSKRIVIEEFVEGSNHGFTCMIRNGKVVFHFFDNEQYYCNPYLVSGACAPGDVPEDAITTLIQLSESIAQDLSLVDGIFHIQFILRDHQPVIVEICRRAPGDLYIELVRHATGVDYAHWIVSASSGIGLANLEQVETRGYFGRHCIMANRNGTVNDVKVSEEVRGKILESVTWWQPGHAISNHLVDKLGIVFLEFSDAEDMRHSMNRMQELIKVQLRS